MLFPSGDSGRLTPFQIRELRRHVVVEFVLPLHQLVPPSNHLLGGQPVVSRQRNKAQVHVWVALIHVDHGGKNVRFSNLCLEKVQRPFK